MQLPEKPARLPVTADHAMSGYDDAFYSLEEEAAARAAEHVVPVVVSMLQPRSVVDVGCGTGAWLEAFRAAGVSDLTGLDGEWVDRQRLLIPEERFVACDISAPIELHRRFELVLCLEVAEHLPPGCAAGLIENLVGLGDVVLFSAAVPGQGGVNHMNEQWPAYWADLFDRHAFRCFDVVRWSVWDDAAVAPFYAQNLLVFAAADRCDTLHQALHAAASLPPKRDVPIAVVHPGLWAESVDRPDAPLYVRYSARELAGHLRKRAHLALRHRSSVYRSGNDWLALASAELRPSVRARARRVARTQKVLTVASAGPQQRVRWRLRPRASRDEVWAVCMVRDEADTLEHTLAHLVDQGVDRFLVADNLSTDGTRELLHRLSARLPILEVHDNLDGYFQADKMTRLARLAWRAGADWILPVDADELWFAREMPLGAYLRGCGAAVVTGRIWNFVPTASDDPSVANPFERINNREEAPHRSTIKGVKVAFRSHALARLAMGNHDVWRPGTRTGGIEIAHFPYRSEEQFVSKFRVGGSAMSSTDLDEGYGTHWRLGGRLDDDELREQWRRVVEGKEVSFDTWLANPRGPLVHDPVWGKSSWSASSPRAWGV